MNWLQKISSEEFPYLFLGEFPCKIVGKNESGHPIIEYKDFPGRTGAVYPSQISEQPRRELVVPKRKQLKRKDPELPDIYCGNCGKFGINLQKCEFCGKERI